MIRSVLAPSAALLLSTSLVLAQGAEAPDPADLPIVELPATGAGDAFAIIYSGDGGWRDLDKTIAENFQRRGIPALGVDSLRYFWSEKTPEVIARDLAVLIRTYSARWQRPKVMLIGYSFGADVMPAAFNLLPDDVRAQVPQISLLGLAKTGAFEVSVSGWLGKKPDDARPTLPELERIDPALIQCFYGREEEDSACAALDPARYEVIATDGGHHFDGDYDALADRILDGLRRREAAAPR
jgi:type IV secretory pathway VirJ component